METEECNNFIHKPVEKPNLLILLSYYCGVFSLLPLVGVVFGPLAVLLSLLGIRRLRKNNEKSGLWLSRIGMLMGILAFGINLYIIYSVLFSS